MVKYKGRGIWEMAYRPPGNLLKKGYKKSYPFGVACVARGGIEPPFQE